MGVLWAWLLVVSSVWCHRVVLNTQDTQPVSPLIFGTSLATYGAKSPKYTINRWGGNAVSVYNYLLDTSNQGNDWFFLNEAHPGSDPNQLPGNSSLTRFIDTTIQGGGTPLVTVPLIGWTPKSRTKAPSFSVKKYGAQKETECTAAKNASWCDADAGNGVLLNGSNVVGNDPTDTCKTIDPEFVRGMVKFLKGRGKQVGFYSMDNEPMLWKGTHRDVHPVGTSFDEIWKLTVQYATVVKQADPSAKVVGPVVWGWCAYFGSGLDSCTDGPDRKKHGDTPFLQWYMQQVAAHQQQTQAATPLVDVLDVHYYPQAKGVSGPSEDPATAKLRLDAPRCLWDSTYKDGSWINQPINLLPRLKGWMPHGLGMGISVSEYSFGPDSLITGALATIDAIGIFASHGVYSAMRWAQPQSGSKLEDAFHMYLNYDQQGGSLVGWDYVTIGATQDPIRAHAFLKGNRLAVIVMNHDPQNTQHVTVAADRTLTGQVSLYSVDKNSPLHPSGKVQPQNDHQHFVVPAAPWSATLCIVSTQQ